LARLKTGKGSRLRTRQAGWCFSAITHATLPWFRCVSWPERDQAGNGSQRDELLHRLVGGAVLTHADRIVREDGLTKDYAFGAPTRNNVISATLTPMTLDPCVCEMACVIKAIPAIIRA
jgi:hypothetical protein